MPELDKMREGRRGGEMKSVKVLVQHGRHGRFKKKKKEGQGRHLDVFDLTG